MAIKIEQCKDAIYEVDRFDVVLLPTTIYLDLHGGLAGKMRYKYPIIQEMNDKQPYADLRRLGTRLTVPVEGGPTVSLIYCCEFPTTKKPYIDYEAFEKGLRTAAAEFKGKRIACTWMGSGKWDGNGDREKCNKIIEECLGGLDVTILDYKQYTYFEERARIRSYLYHLKKKDKQKFKEMGLNEDILLKRMYLRDMNHDPQPLVT